MKTNKLDKETQEWVDARAKMLNDRLAQVNPQPVELPIDHRCHEAIKWSKGLSGKFCFDCGQFH